MKFSKSTWTTIIQFLLTFITALATAFGVSSCVEAC